MDYFDQYTYAATTAQMIAEIGYTEILTITSMLISAPFVALGSYAVGAYIEASNIASIAAQKLVSGAAEQATSIASAFVSQLAIKSVVYEIGKQVLIGTLRETVEEIVVDGLFETSIQSAVRMVGGPSDMGHWISTLFTSTRESMNFASFTGHFGSQTQQAQGFTGQVQTAMGLSTDFQAIVGEMMDQNIDENFAHIVAANEQFLTVQMAEIGLIGETLQDSKISVGRLLATGIFTGLSLLTPSLAGFNIYGASKLVGGIGSKIDAKIQNMFLAARNSKMLLKDAKEAEKQEVEMGKKPIVSQTEDIKPEYMPEVSKTPGIPSTLLESTPVEAAVVAAGGYSNFMSFGEFRSGRPVTHHQVIQEAINEEIKMKGLLITQAQRTIEALGGGIVAQGDLKQTLLAIRAEDKLNIRQFTKVADTLTKYYEAINTEKTISDIEGIYDASAIYIIRHLNEKIGKGKLLNNFEDKTLDLIIELMKSSQGSYKTVYSGFISKKGWLRGRPSGMAPFYKTFLSKIASTLSEYNVIDTDPTSSKENFLESVRELTRAMGLPEDSLWGKITDLKTGRQYEIPEELLTTYFLSIEALVHASHLPPSEAYKCMEDIESDFDFIYYVQGDMSKNPFYSEARLMYFRIKTIVDNAHSVSPIPNYIGTLRSLDRNVLIGAAVESFLIRTKEGQVTRPSTIDNHRNVIDSSLSAYLTTQQMDKIHSLLDNFKSKIFAYHELKDTLNSYENSFRKHLIVDIVNSEVSIILKLPYSVNSLSFLLLGDRTDLKQIFLSSIGEHDIHSRPFVYELLHMRLRVRTWIRQDFISEGLEIDQNTLNKLRKEVIAKIDNFIRFNKNNFALLNEYRKLGEIGKTEYKNYKRKPYIKITSRKSYEVEFELQQALRLALSAYYGNSKVSFTMMEDIFGLGAALQHASQGHQFSLNTLMKINIKLEEFIKKDASRTNFRYDFMKRLTSDQRQKIYQDAKNSLEKYMKRRKIDRPKSWSKELMKAYHVLTLLKRHLGFDILTFTRLQDKLFEIGPGIKKAPFKDIFIRHHFRNSVFRKLSLNSRDLILTNEKIHSQYSSYSEAEIIVIIEGFEKMMNMKGSGIGGAITRGDVVDIFRGNEWVINEEDGWFKDLKLFESELKEFNKRREYLNSEGSDEFIEKFYKSAYNRFYLNFPHEDSRSVANGDGFYSMVEPHPWLGDLKMFIDIDLIGYARIDITNEYWDFFLR